MTNDRIVHFCIGAFIAVLLITLVAVLVGFRTGHADEDKLFEILKSLAENAQGALTIVVGAWLQATYGAKK